MKYSDFTALLAEETGVPADRLEVLCGFPPKLLATPAPDTKLREAGLSNGDSLTVREAAAAGDGAPAAAAAPAPAPASQVTTSQSQPSLPVAADVPSASPQPGAASTAVCNNASAPTCVTMPDGTCVVRRIIDSDNSCLFNSIGYVMEQSRARSAQLRRAVAAAVSADPFTYNEGFLGKNNAEYCKWITDPSKWGGAIELSILARHYETEIAAYDIQTKRCDVYGQGSGYRDRVMLIYDGLHYDALALSVFEGAPEELDVTKFEPGNGSSAAIEAAAAQLVEACHQARQFTDMAKFTLRCGVCQRGLKGEKEAVEHAKATGHSNFAEY